ncbi:MAG: hypothetical protein P8R54_27895 [Myxococcota bacterium]|nr:hypothetical protein [Myxococcota bacterium]
MGCETSPEPPSHAIVDRDRYLAILRDSEQPSSSAMASCHALVDDNLRGDCALAISRRAMSPGSEATWCLKVPAGTWQDECWFQSAESAAMRHNYSLAQTLCSSSGRFSRQCNFHLFQLHVQQSPGLVGDLPEAEALLEALIADWKVQWASQATERVWSSWFQLAAQEHGWADTEACQAVSAARKEACISGIAQAAKVPRR